MAYPFPNHLETFTQPNHQNLQSLTSIFLNRNSPATGISPNDDSSFSSSPGSNNSNQRSPSTPTFPNYQVPTRIGFMSNTSINSFYFNPSDDWMSWKEYNQREFSSSPTGISNTTPNTPSAIYLKTETTLPSTSESISLGMMNNSNLNHSDNMMENGFMTNPVYCDTPETFLRLQNQHLLAELPPLHNQGDVCPYSLTYSPDMGLNLVEPDGHYKHESYNPRNTPSSLRMDVLGEDTTSSFTLSSHQQLQENAVDLQSEGIEEAHTEEYILPAINQSDSDSNCDVNPDHISKSPPSQAKLGVNSSNFVDLESPVKKRKFNYAIDDEETQYPSTHGLIHDPYPNKSSSIRETVNHKGVHTNGLTRPPKKTAHNMIEKRYRTNLNEKIAALRDAVPSLRIVVRCGGGLIRQSSKNSNKVRKDEQKTSRLTRVARKDTVDRSDIERDDLQGLTAASKLNKATILAKATEYIAHLEHRNHALLEERETLRCRIDALEKLGHSIQAGELSKARAQRSMDY